MRLGRFLLTKERNIRKNFRSQKHYFVFSRSTHAHKKCHKVGFQPCVVRINSFLSLPCVKMVQKKFYSTNQADTEETERFLDLKDLLNKKGTGLIDIAKIYSPAEAEVIKSKLKATEHIMPTDLIILEKPLDPPFPQNMNDWFAQYHVIRGMDRIIYIIIISDTKNSGFHLGYTVTTMAEKKGYNLSEIANGDVEAIKKAVNFFLDRNMKHVDTTKKQLKKKSDYTIIAIIISLFVVALISTTLKKRENNTDMCRTCNTKMQLNENEDVLKTVLLYGERCERSLHSRNYMVFTCPNCWGSWKQKGDTIGPYTCLLYTSPSPRDS
eukprot:TRINITY_DN1714_c0_g1_i4.p1 TRINITY_DN1714_c0_g1~~TRINITY_DN1714_c0_g1_i4.p1  ORF type:complete len:324 (-),score=27.37 TRINITY_DN1714_c0_g1_i4:6-977(-)